MDLSSAFDTPDHEILLTRLQHRFGIVGTALNWFKSYLTDRSQAVVVNGVTSDSRRLPYGVPQGSVLGPVLFTLYFAPLEDVIKKHGLDCMLYADDTQLYVSLNPKNRNPGLSSLECCLQDITCWLSSNKLVCNHGKTEVLHFTSRFRQHLPISVSLHGNEIPPKPEARDLGVVLDSHLQLTTHVNNVCKSASLGIRNIGRIRKYIGKTEAERLIHAFVSSKLDYCNGILYGLPDYQIKKLQRLQNTAARIVTRTKFTDHISPVLQDLHWLPIKQRIIFKLLLITYKALHGHAPAYITALLQEYKPARSLRSSTQNLLSVPRTYTSNYGDRSFSVAGPALWNSLPDTIRKSDSVSQFKSTLKTLLFQSAYT